MRVVVDTEVCIGSGNCVRLADDIFDQDDAATVLVRIERPPADREAVVRAAAAACPTGAITILDD